MADTILKSKAQLRSINVTSNGNSSNLAEKTPPTPSKLMINHGKPNFTIPRSPKAEKNGEGNPLTNELQPNKDNNYNPYKKAESQSYKNNNNLIISTKFNGAFKPTNLPLTQNGNDENDNEAAKVVLRRPKAPEPISQGDGEDDNVPEFIKRQRRIQERLAKENVLDFENRRSGYFTHMVISPTSPIRQSLVETMTSPAVVPALEIPPTSPTSTQTAMTTTFEQHTEAVEPSVQQEIAIATNGHATNGHVQVEEEEEVAKAIEEVNKAVAGEDDEKASEQQVQTVHVVEHVEKHVEEHSHVEVQSHVEVRSHVEERSHVEQHSHVEERSHVEEHSHVEELTLVEEHVPQSVSSEPVVPVVPTWHPVETSAEGSVNVPAVVEAVATMEITKTAVEENAVAPTNGHVEVVEVHVVPKENGHDSDVTISHTNGSDDASIPGPEANGALKHNGESKIEDSNSESNKNSDVVKVIAENGDAKTVF